MWEDLWLSMAFNLIRPWKLYSIFTDSSHLVLTPKSSMIEDQINKFLSPANSFEVKKAIWH